MEHHLKKYVRSQELVSLILEDQEILSTLSTLEPKIFYQLITHVGLEEAGELLSMASTDQLEKMFDADLWKREEVGASEHFDPKRFALWLEIMSEMGHKTAAERLLEMDEDFVLFALSSQIVVVDLSALNLYMWSKKKNSSWDEDDLMDRVMESSLSHEFEDYLVLARHEEGWDTLLNILLEWDRDHYDFLRLILGRCSDLSKSDREEKGGLYNLLSEKESLLEDVQGDREDRLQEVGFVTPSAAISFLSLAEQTPLEMLLTPHERDPITASFFRNHKQSLHKNNYEVASEKKERLIKLLKEFSVLPSSATPLLPEHHHDEEDNLLKSLLSQLMNHDKKMADERFYELNYLANILMLWWGPLIKELF